MESRIENVNRANIPDFGQSNLDLYEEQVRANTLNRDAKS